MPEARTYEGGCHCGKVRYKVETDLARVMECNCSICSKKAYLLAFVPASAFELLSGADSLTDYQFNKHVVHHQFCSTCGIQSFGWGITKDGQKMFSVNVRCLDGVDLAGLTVTQVDGKKL
ncbi:MAG TPA: GFA family protein [Polyangiaceae bacterium]|nr:GFA family protein [Polyangiaceae bacterium]